jgi:1,4-dihydroxy-2-naphthoyl-CoA hydrolase
LERFQPSMGGAGESSSKPPPPSAGVGTGDEGDLRAENMLHALGFEITRIFRCEVAGRLTITEKCCHAFKMLNGSVSALMAEATAGIHAYIASRYRRVAGVHR